MQITQFKENYDNPIKNKTNFVNLDNISPMLGSRYANQFVSPLKKECLYLNMFYQFQTHCKFTIHSK